MIQGIFLSSRTAEDPKDQNLATCAAAKELHGNFE